MKIQFRKAFKQSEPQYIADFLAEQVELSKMKIKHAIGLGGLWIQKSGQKKKLRVKKIKTLIHGGDYIEFFYDDSLEFVSPDKAFELYKGQDFGVWYKPVNMLADGSPYSDQGSLSYAIKSKSKKCFLIQRLDREVSGLMLVAYSKKMAAFFSKELQEKKIKKYYQIEVIGFTDEEGTIDQKLDGKNALTHYKLHAHNDGTSLLDIEIETGRYHQIRRHMNAIYHPILGDPKYGEGNKNKDGLKLVANRIEFFDPQKRKRIELEIEQSLRLF